MDDAGHWMVKAAAIYGIVKIGEFCSYPKVQTWTVSQYSASVSPELPPLAGMAKAPRTKRRSGSQTTLSA